ncbi:hypothetical protein PTKIN_Ptkin14bG0153700 [Pterospermum kingtungense]
MFPWFAFGHFLPYLHLSNKLADKGHNVSFLLPKRAQSKLEKVSHYPNLIHFLSLVVHHVDGVLPGSKTASDVPYPLHKLLAIAFDQTRDQVEAILRDINPDLVFYDLGHWIPVLAKKISFKSIYHTRVSATTNSQSTKKTKEMTAEELTEVPTGYPSSKVELKAEEAAMTTIMSGDQILNTRLMVEELKVAVEVERAVNRRICTKKLSKAIKLVMEKGNELAGLLERNHAKLKKFLTQIFKKNMPTISFKVC